MIAGLDSELWVEWGAHPCTRAFIQHVDTAVSREAQETGGGRALNTESLESTALAYARAVGYTLGCQSVLNEIERIVDRESTVGDKQ